MPATKARDSLLESLAIDGLTRTDRGEIPTAAHFETNDDLRVVIFDVQEADSSNAFWVRVLEQSGDVLVDGHVSESIYESKKDIVEMVENVIVGARMTELGQGAEEAQLDIASKG